MFAPKMKALVVGGSAVAALLAVGGVAYAADATAPSSAPAASTAQPEKPKAAHHKGLLARAEHGEFTARVGKQDGVFDMQRGLVTQVSATSITVKSPDGFTATYAIDPASKIREDKKAATIGDVKTGDRVQLIATKSGSTATVKRIGDHGPATK